MGSGFTVMMVETRTQWLGLLLDRLAIEATCGLTELLLFVQKSKMAATSILDLIFV